MRSWIILLGAMLSWTAHFFVSYIVSITVGGAGTGRMLVLVVSIGCLAANLYLLVLASHALRNGDEFSRWIAGGGMTLLLLSTVAILFQTLPALS